MIKLMRHLKNSRLVISQIKQGEWITRKNVIDGMVYTAKRGGYSLWLANGPFFCEVIEFNGESCQPAFGLLFRHYVWWAAARKLKGRLEIKHIPRL